MTEHDGAGFKAGALLDFAGQLVADAAHAHVPEFIFPPVGEHHIAMRIDIGRELGAFGGDHNAEVAAAGVAQLDGLGDFVDVEGSFGDQDHVGAAGDAAVHGDPACVTTHDFHHHHAVVRFGRGVHAIDGAGGHVDCGVEAEGVVGSGKIVVDSLGNSDHFYLYLKELLGDRERVITADGDEGVDLVLLKSLDAQVEAVAVFGRVGARGAQNGATAGKNAADAREVEGHEFVLHQSPPAFEKSHKLVLVVKVSLAHHGADDRVQSWAIASASQHSYLHGLLLTNMNCRPVPRGIVCGYTFGQL